LKRETALFLEKSRGPLAQAETMLRVGLIEAAGRTAYLAEFHAAQAVIFETTGRVFKRHATAQGEFGRLVKDDPRFDTALRVFLPRAYNLKAISDYETGSGSHVSAESAGDAIQTARRFLTCVMTLIPPTGHNAPPASESDLTYSRFRSN
jgi:uncharacterized protein (UPF0332 family)